MTYIYILLGIIILWQIGADIRYYQINKKIQIMHDTDKNLLELVQTCMMKKDEKKEEKPKYCASLGGIRTSYTQAVKAKASGYIKGFPDLQVCYPTSKFYGLFLEIKKDKKSYATKEQKEWVNYLNSVGYYAQVCKGLEDCLDVIDWYLEGEYDIK